MQLIIVDEGDFVRTRMIDMLAGEIALNEKRRQKIKKCQTHMSKLELARKYAIANAKYANVKVTDEDLCAITYKAVMAIDRMQIR